MKAQNELSNPNSCINRALPHERTFVLLGRDAAAPEAIRIWCQQRFALGLNKMDDPQMLEAIETAEAMEREFDNIRIELAIQRKSA